MLVKNKTTEENRKFWEHIEAVSAEVAKWPSWKRSTDPIGDAGKEEAKEKL